MENHVNARDSWDIYTILWFAVIVFQGWELRGGKKGVVSGKLKLKKTYAYHEYIYVYLYIVVCPLLYWTADRCSPKLCFILFSGWFRFRCEDWEGATAVHLGIKGGHAEVCRFLMEARADPQEALDFGTSAQSNP